MNINGNRGRRGVDLKTGIAVSMAVAVALVLVPAAAQATSKSWGTFTVSDGGTVRAQAWGTASVTSTQLKNAMTYTSSSYEDARVETTWKYYEESQDASGAYHSSWTDEGRTDSPNWRKISKRTFTASSPPCRMTPRKGGLNRGCACRDLGGSRYPPRRPQS